jgi:hypothetical protein
LEGIIMDMSETIGAIAGALAEAQATIGGAIKGKVNPAFKSKYADLASVWEAWQAVGPAQGLAVAQFAGPFVDGKVRVTSMLMHKSGEWMRETSDVPVSKVDAQGYVSATTYARRCALSALVGVCPEDDDGAAASRSGGAPLRSVEITGPVSTAQLAELQALADEVQPDMQRLCKYFDVASLADMPAAKFGDARAALLSKRKVRA